MGNTNLWLLRYAAPPKHLQKYAQKVFGAGMLRWPDLFSLVEDLPAYTPRGRREGIPVPDRKWEELRSSEGRMWGRVFPVEGGHVLLALPGEHGSRRVVEPFAVAYAQWLREHRPEQVFAGRFDSQGHWRSDLQTAREGLADAGALLTYHSSDMQGLQTLDVTTLSGGAEWDRLALQAEQTWDKATCQSILRATAEQERKRSE